jgi:hypothetical protein
MAPQISKVPELDLMQATLSIACSVTEGTFMDFGNDQKCRNMLENAFIGASQSLGKDLGFSPAVDASYLVDSFSASRKAA